MPADEDRRLVLVSMNPEARRTAAIETVRRTVAGPVGDIELLVDSPTGPPRGLAVIAHPQPLLGGSALHKIPQVLARGVRDLGWLAVRPNFRGVGGTAGNHDHGVGEADDILAVIHAMEWSVPLALIGFSFGAFVQSRVASRLAGAGKAAQHVVLAGLPVGSVEGGRVYDTASVPNGSVVIHGQLDERVALSALLQWAEVHSLPVVVVPGADHFFKGKLPMLRSIVQAELQRLPTSPP